ncbi:NmrA family transcriptional regulator [Geodermatophilus sp. YIM 151500]|uniref:NmrA family transcriptional regulator n=1 Tax=Geodermatophilus sp. YIM 151500 TaxID=2984531 RepID=UPI0021E47C43|nr:NmrA family transcriptional regulator [Geodermatophilus sp. YIM 151500]MCV2491366.1 NmrA family transcriptional regulator [Geodermatophilus sp. YIM 151500]
MTGETDDGRILVLGATGSVGRRVAGLLREAGRPVTTASPSAAVRFDWTEPATWDAAVDGATGAFVMAPDGVPVDHAFLRRAADAGVRRLVLLSSRAVEAMGDERLLAAEAAVRDAGPAWSVVRADWFDQNFDEGVFRDAVLAGEVVVPVGDVRQAFVDAGDVAAVAVAVLLGKAATGATYDVTGPEALSFGEAVGVVARAAGRPVRHLGEPDDYWRTMTGSGLDAAQVRREIEAFAALRALGDDVPTRTVEQLTGRAATSFADYAADAAVRGAWRGA